MKVKAIVIDNDDLDEIIKKTIIGRTKTIIDSTIEASKKLDEIKDNNYSRKDYEMATHFMSGCSFIHKDVIKEFDKEYIESYRKALSNISKHIMCMHTKMFEFIEENSRINYDETKLDLESLSKEELIAMIKNNK